MEFRLPHITGGTVQQQVDQIVAYLRQTALALQALPERQEAQTIPGDRDGGRSCVFPSLLVQGSLNGVYTRRLTLQTGDTIRIQPGVGADSRQCFHLWGYMEAQPVEGLLLASPGGCSWKGTEGITSRWADGALEIQLNQKGVGCLVIQSHAPFSPL